MATAGLIIDHRGGLGGNPLRTQFLFPDKEGAELAFNMLRDAVAAYHNRANDRERVVTFDHLAGRAAVDVSEIASLSVDAVLEPEARAAVEEWEVALSEVKAKGLAAAKAIAGEQVSA